MYTNNGDILLKPEEYSNKNAPTHHVRNPLHLKADLKLLNSPASCLSLPSKLMQNGAIEFRCDRGCFNLLSPPAIQAYARRLNRLGLRLGPSGHTEQPKPLAARSTASHARQRHTCSSPAVRFFEGGVSRFATFLAISRERVPRHQTRRQNTRTLLQSTMAARGTRKQLSCSLRSSELHKPSIHSHTDHASPRPFFFFFEKTMKS